jgi:hypothetical protein
MVNFTSYRFLFDRKRGLAKISKQISLYIAEFVANISVAKFNFPAELINPLKRKWEEGRELRKKSWISQELISRSEIC